ncbi:hypothetical protein ACF08O_07780 [Streptomyces paradoxus]|uniref:hypothetical protein n=1 Tax=Streptomyces paradoxus TaxID=66375 RepID=UPI0036FC3A4C
MATVYRVYGLGVTLFDTVELYGFGTGSNEHLPSRAVKGFRDRGSGPGQPPRAHPRVRREPLALAGRRPHRRAVPAPRPSDRYTSRTSRARSASRPPKARSATSV